MENNQEVTLQIKSLRLQRGDILVAERDFSSSTYLVDALRIAGKEAGIDFEVPIVFVDNIDGIAVVKLGGL